MINKTKFEELLFRCVELGATDIHLSVGRIPCFRINGDLHLDGNKENTKDDLNNFIELVLSTEKMNILKVSRSVDIGYSSEKGERYRINIFYEKSRPALAIRLLAGKFYKLEELRLPSQLRELTALSDGLVLVTGSTGSGKSTTLASIVNEINEKRSCHILTIEDPIEYLYEGKKSIVNQREISSDANSFAEAIVSAMRQDPDVILLGEMRDTATMQAALMAAETGHLVFSTLHTNDAVGVIDRLIGSFPGAEQDAVRQQLSMVLRAIVTQTLVKNSDGGGRIPINEILFVDNAVSNLIRLHKPEQIRSSIETGRERGSQSYDYSLALRVKEGYLTANDALVIARNKNSLKEYFKIVNVDFKERVST
tara:strand:+ start:1909 stop:3009 length:1101 start_codon:yes stop_codon:yes gene_type:complete